MEKCNETQGEVIFWLKNNLLSLVL